MTKGYVELIEDKDENLLPSPNFQSGQTNNQPILSNQTQNTSNSDSTPYFKVLGFGDKLKYWMNRKKEKMDHVYRVVKPYPLNINSKSALNTNCNMYPPVSTSNKVDNMKYGFLLFIPLFLYNQFKYFFNLFFLLLCISQFIEPLKIGFISTYIGPLVFVLSLSLYNEVSDELKRFCRDLEVNRKRVT